jgi:hypothetical protein
VSGPLENGGAQGIIKRGQCSALMNSGPKEKATRKAALPCRNDCFGPSFPGDLLSRLSSNDERWNDSNWNVRMRGWGRCRHAMLLPAKPVTNTRDSTN